MKASELLQLRRDELAFSDEVTWVNRAPRAASKEACLVAGGEYALCRATAANGWGHVPALFYLRRALRARGRHEPLIRWNDRIKRRLADVLALYDEAIILAKEAEASEPGEMKPDA